MKTIGLLGGTAWISTIDYYRLINQMVNERLGDFHSAQLILKSIDYHDFRTNYGKNDKKVCSLLKVELEKLISLQPDCLIICNNTLHKYLDLIKGKINLEIPLFHAVDLTADYLHNQQYKEILFLATKNTMEDGFFTRKLREKGIGSEIPNEEERNAIQHILLKELIKGITSEDSKRFFKSLIKKYQNCEAVVLGCTELPMIVTAETSFLPIINPIHLQCAAAVEYIL